MRIPLWEAKSKPEKFQCLWWTKKAESDALKKGRAVFTSLISPLKEAQLCGKKVQFLIFPKGKSDSKVCPQFSPII